MSSVLPDYLPTTEQRLGQNPLLPLHPETQAVGDAQYFAQEAMLRAEVARRYADILQQLGYVSDTGEFIPGLVSTQASTAQRELQRGSDLATEDVTNRSQREGTLFSGYRGTQTARAQYPYQQQIGQLGVDVPLALGRLHGDAAGLIDQYTLQNNLLLADAAARRAAMLTETAAAPTQAPSEPTALEPGAIQAGPLPPQPQQRVQPPQPLNFASPEMLDQIAAGFRNMSSAQPTFASNDMLDQLAAVAQKPKKKTTQSTSYASKARQLGGLYG